MAKKTPTAGEALFEQLRQDALKRPKAAVSQADYWAVVCLKRGENGLWAPLEQPFPTKDEAETHAEALKEGNQGAVKVMPRMWA